MSSKNKNEKKYRKRKHLGAWFQVGRLIIIAGAILTIIVAILDLINYSVASETWDSYTFGQLGIQYLGGIIAIVCGALLLWMIIDNYRFAYKMNLILLAIIIIVIAIIAGNIGGLVCIIGAILLIFEQLTKS